MLKLLLILTDCSVDCPLQSLVELLKKYLGI